MMDRAYEDKLNGKVPEQLWERKSVEWNNELVDIQFQIKSHESANLEYYKTGVDILELANQAYDMYLQQSCQKQRRLLNIILSNCTFDHGTLCPIYNKPFDILAKGPEFRSKRG
jgi:hypothetical protein